MVITEIDSDYHTAIPRSSQQYHSQHSWGRLTDEEVLMTRSNVEYLSISKIDVMLALPLISS